jgi:hypothetical protein
LVIGFSNNETVTFNLWALANTETTKLLPLKSMGIKAQCMQNCPAVGRIEKHPLLDVSFPSAGRIAYCTQSAFDFCSLVTEVCTQKSTHSACSFDFPILCGSPGNKVFPFSSVFRKFLLSFFPHSTFCTTSFLTSSNDDVAFLMGVLLFYSSKPYFRYHLVLLFITLSLNLLTTPPLRFYF